MALALQDTMWRNVDKAVTCSNDEANTWNTRYHESHHEKWDVWSYVSFNAGPTSQTVVQC